MPKASLLQRLLRAPSTSETSGDSKDSDSNKKSETTTQQGVTPLDAFAGLWQTSPEVDENGKPIKDESPKDLTNLLTINPEKINEAASKINFSQVVTPEQAEAITAGGEEAQTAFIEAINNVSQHVFSQSLVANASLLQETLTKTDDIIDRKANESIKRQNISDKIVGSNELLAHPTVSPLVEVIRTNLTSKFPDATPQEISEATVEYLQNVTEALSVNPEDDSLPLETITDWEAFAGLAEESPDSTSG